MNQELVWWAEFIYFRREAEIEHLFLDLILG